jgi:signal transduction histidine kinase
MADTLTIGDRNFAEAFAVHEQRQRIYTGKVACLLVIFLMPVGFCLDYFVYPSHLQLFLAVRILTSFLACGLLYLHFTEFGSKHYRLLGVPIALLPAAGIAWMIYSTEGPASPYYAGLNLIVLAVSVVVRFNRIESVAAVGGIFLLYFATCVRGITSFPMFVNNCYFLLLTGIIVVVGNHFFTQLRIQEFTLRYQLDQNKREIEETNRKLVEVDKLKSRFFANVSHEMRTPLTLLISPLESLIKRFEGSDDANANDLLDTMRSNSMRLLKLINDLLDLVRVESGRMDIKSEPMAVVDFFKGLSSAIRQVAAEKNIQVITHVDEALGTFLTDRDKLEKILLNLLFNALKFTPAGGKIELQAKKKDEEVLLSVSDTGIGIAEKSLPYVFDRFWQADNSSRRKYQGVGIGLSLVKELSEMMGGGVSVTSTEGKGTTFVVRLPYRKAPEKEPVLDIQGVPVAAKEGGTGSEEWLSNLYRRAEFFPATTARKPAKEAKPTAITGRKPVALIADDEPDMLHFLRSELQNDYDLIEATDGAQALQKTEMFMPDVVLLDMMMPEMDGLDVCRALREREATAGIPVILLTARADEETKYDALQIGANDFLAKPFSATELNARIKNLVDSHDYQRKLSKQNQALTSAIEQIKDTETQLVQSEKLASLGRMSAGIIHEINNPLNFATTGLFALRNKAKNFPQEERVEYESILSDVEEGLKRVRNIVSDLRVFTHPESGPPESVDIAEVVNASLRFLATEWKDRVRMENNIVPGQVAQANRNKLVHILVNLLQNSLDAMRHKKYDGEQQTIWIEGRLEEGKSVIVVRDNGTGIEKKNLGKIFDPFFTTKDVGEGMGLGLSICHRIVRGYGGHINVRSEPGRFCEFILDFPEKAQPRKTEEEPEIPPVSATEAGVTSNLNA